MQLVMALAASAAVLALAGYAVWQSGYQLRAVVMPIRIKSRDFVRQLEDMVAMCSRTLGE